MSKTDDEMACQELVELVTDHLDGCLTLPERLRFEAHLAACSGCRAYLEQMRLTLGVLGGSSERSISPEARERLLRVYRAWSAQQN
ncbi:MAG TPA: zf-HC2 domain-containing protein [Roseiflexaceae bacterium]|jgi:predicted anti-sigma-YlaC factor YlaD